MYKNQYILTICAILGFLYTLFFYYQDSRLENPNMLKSYTITEQGCRNSKGSSSVHIKYNNKIYYIRLANKECLKYPVGTEISLSYNKQFDYFYKPDGLKRDRNRLFFTAIIFILSIIPWKKIIKIKA
ncbi:Uncharacterised protein [Chryseobacterium indologenes]|nr:Uncharacterised protein [Chryseobacterium indologenes]